MPYEVHQVSVRFAGAGAGEGEFTWGQREWWKEMLRDEGWWPLGGVVSVPPGRSLGDLVEETRWRLCRFPALRTRVTMGADGRPRQRVSASGIFEIDVVEVGDEDPLAAATRLAAQYTDTAFDHESDWPMRMAVVCRNGQPTHVVVLVSHLVIDAAGIRALVSETEARPEVPPRGQTSLEQAAWQASAAGRRQNAAALRYWGEVLNAVPPSRFHNPHGPLSPGIWHGVYDSYALLPAVQVISERSGFDLPTVFLALFAVAMHRVRGVDPVVVRPVVDNRFRPGLADAVCTAAQHGVCLIEVSGTAFKEVLQRAARSARTAFKYAYVDPWDVDALIQRAEIEREASLDTHCRLNNRFRAGTAPEFFQGPVPPSTFRWTDRNDGSPLKDLTLQIDDIPGGVRLGLHINTAAFAPDDAETLARVMESVAVFEAGGGMDPPDSPKILSGQAEYTP